MLNFGLVEVDGLCCPVIDNNYMLKNTSGDNTGLCAVVNSDVDGSDVSLFGDITNNFKLESNHLLSDLKTMAHQFGMKLNFVIVRSGMRILCNRPIRYGNRKFYEIRIVPSISCGCDWVVRFKFLDTTKCTLSDIAKIVQIFGIHTNTCDPTFSDQYIVARKKAGEYKQCTDPILRKVMH